MSTVEEIPRCKIGSTKHAAAAKDGRATGHSLCAKHYDKLARMLREIERETGDLEVAPSIAMHWNTSGGGGGGGAPAFEQAPARLAPLVLTSLRQGEGNSEDGDERHASGRIEPVLVVLSKYANRVREERRFGPPTITITDCTDRLAGTPKHGPTYGLPCLDVYCRGITYERTYPLPLTVASERQLLSRQVDWMVDWPDIDTVFTHLRHLLSNLRRANGTAPKPLGACPVDKPQGGPCHGPLWPVKPLHTSGEGVWTGSSPSAVSCAACGVRWEGPGELARLAVILEIERKAKAAS